MVRVFCSFDFHCKYYWFVVLVSQRLKCQFMVMSIGVGLHVGLRASYLQDNSNRFAVYFGTFLRSL